MFWYYIITFFGNILNFMFSFLPRVETLPLGMDSALTTAMGYFNAFKDLIPYLGLLFTTFMWYLAFRIVLLTLKLLRIIPS